MRSCKGPDWCLWAFDVTVAVVVAVDDMVEVAAEGGSSGSEVSGSGVRAEEAADKARTGEDRPKRLRVDRRRGNAKREALGEGCSEGVSGGGDWVGREGKAGGLGGKDIDSLRTGGESDGAAFQGQQDFQIWELGSSKVMDE